MPKIVRNDDLVEFSVEEAHNLSVRPEVHHSNPLAPGAEGGLLKIIDQKHEYKMLHLVIPTDVLIPQASCEVWNPSTKSFMTDDKITCGYFEVNETMCPDEYMASCLHNISSKGASVEGVMLDSTTEISAITAALVVGVNSAVASGVHKIGMFGDPNIGTSSYHSADKVSYLENRDIKQRDRFFSMMQVNEGIDTILRRRAGNGRIKFVDSNDGTADGNATLPSNIKDFLLDMLNNSHDALRYWKRYSGVSPVFKLQSGLFEAYVSYLESLEGGSIRHQFIVNGTPIEGVYSFRGYPVMEWVDADMFDNSIGLKRSNGHSWNQRAIFVAPDVLTLMTNVREVEGIGSGLVIQRAPDITQKGKINMFMTLGVGAGIAHERLVTYSYNSSYTYTAS